MCSHTLVLCLCSAQLAIRWDIDVSCLKPSPALEHLELAALCRHPLKSSLQEGKAATTKEQSWLKWQEWLCQRNSGGPQEAFHQSWCVHLIRTVLQPMRLQDVQPGEPHSTWPAVTITRAPKRPRGRGMSMESLYEVWERSSVCT